MASATTRRPRTAARAEGTLAYELAEHFIRVNAICPTAVDTPMIQNQTLHRAFRPDLENPGREDVKAGSRT